MDVARVIDSLGKIATKQQLVDRGLSGFDLTAAVRRGEIRRVRRAHYATPGALPAAIAAIRVGGKLGGPSAARSYGLWSGFDDRIHVVLPRNASRLRTNLPPSISENLTPDTSEREVVLHWLNSPSVGGECWRVTARETLRQMAAWTDAETAVACLDTARSILRFTDGDLRATFESAPVSERLLFRRSRSGSDAGSESVVRQRLVLRGIEVDQQVTIAGVGRVDMIVRGTRVVIEVDGREFHSSATAFENDRRRDSELAARGFIVIRLSFAQVFGDWARCEHAIVAAITQFRNL